MQPYGIISDTHNHAWSAFATTLPSGVNSRLQWTLDETTRAAQEVLLAGGRHLYHGGDLFHVRGNLAPSVLNPTLDCYKSIVKMGITPVLNAGNHDLEGKEAARVSSAITAMEGVGCVVINKPYLDYRRALSDVAVFPWIPNITELKAAIENIDPADRGTCDLLLHAPIDGVIKGLPDHGLSDTYLAGLGFKRVFSGHYHNNKDFGNGVWSIGALTHQSWSDVGSKAGFLIVTDAGVKWHCTHAPRFVEVDASMDADEIAMAVDGNFAKVTINSSKTGDVDAMRQFLLDSGAQGVIVLAEKIAAGVSRVGATYKAGTSLDVSINDFIKAQSYKRVPELSILCADILSRVRAVA